MIRTSLAILIAAIALTGCAASPRPEHAHAECLPCKYNNDMACIDIEVDETTPRLVDAGGVTRHFCSEDCRRAFEKTPKKFLAVAERHR